LNDLYLSTDGGVTSYQASANGVDGNVRASGGFPFNQNQYYLLTTAGIYVSTNNGDDFVDKTGDWAFDFNIDIGHGIIVPDWTE